MQPSASRTAAQRTLVTILLSAVVGWGLFVLAIYTDIVVESGLTPEQLYGVDRVDIVRPSKYLIFAAIALVALTAVWAKNRMRAQLASGSPASRLTPAIESFAGSVVIITLVLSAIMALNVFMSSFFDSSSGVDVVIRVLDTYLPIVLFTALAVTVLLAGFVFTRHLPRVQFVDQPAGHESAGLADPATLAAPDTAGHTGAATPATAVEATPDPAAQRATALAFTVPIVAVAAALIFGLIVYDLTQNALPVWIWVIVQAGVGAGIVSGTVYAAKALDARRLHLSRPAGASVGAKNLNLVLSIIFAAAVTLMSLGYGASAAEQLRVNTFLSISAYASAPLKENGELDLSEGDEFTVMINGSDLQRNSDVTVTLEPGSTVLLESEVDWEGYLGGEVALPPETESGEYELTLRAQSASGAELEVTLAVTVDDGVISLPNGMEASTSDQAQQIIAPTLGWVGRDLLPALLMILLAAFSLYVTLNARNRDAFVSEPENAVADTEH